MIEHLLQYVFIKMLTTAYSLVLWINDIVVQISFHNMPTICRNAFHFLVTQEISNRLLHWFMEIKESHGSVEVTSLKQVDAIKDRGIFKVGHSQGTAVKNKHQLVKKRI